MAYVAAGMAAFSMVKGMADKNKKTAAPKKANPIKKFKRTDMSKQFNTPLSEEEMSNFELWKIEEQQMNGKDWEKDMPDYDVQGFFQAGERLDSRNHGSDRFKKPSHPTFSNQSMYSGSRKPDGGQYLGGEWGRNGDRDTYSPNQSQFDNGTHDKDDMRKYFDAAEEGNELIFPTMN